MSADAHQRFSSKQVRSVLWDLQILIVEDEEFPRTILEKKLSNLCEHVEVAQNGEEAFEYYQKHYFDLIITDLEMPGQNGFWLIEKIREDSLQKPILVTTAYSDEEHMHRCLDLGVSGFIVKPIDSSVLYRTLYHFGSLLHEKKVMYQYQQELERYTSTSRNMSKQYSVLKDILEETLTFDQKQAIITHFNDEDIPAPRFLFKGMGELEKSTPEPVFKKEESVVSADDDFAYDAFKADDLQRFYEAEEDIRDFLSEMFLHPESSHEVFHRIAPQIALIGESLLKYPPYATLSEKLQQLSTTLETVSHEQELKRFNYLFESFMDTLGEWCHVVLGGREDEKEIQTDIYTVMHDVDILVNAIKKSEAGDDNDLELF